MPKKGNYAGINELRESVYFRPHAQVQDDESSSSQKEASVAPVEPPIPAQTTESNDTPTLLKKELKKTSRTVIEKTKQPSNEATNERTKDRSHKREKIRHTFDIYKDQLLSLRQVTLEREAMFGDRVLLGDVVQEALDMFITKERNKE